MLNKQEMQLLTQRPGGKNFLKYLMLRMMLRLAEQNNSVTALFFIHFSK